MATKKVLTRIPDTFHDALDAENDNAAIRVVRRLEDRALLSEAALDAANAGRLAVVAAAVESGADPNGVDEEGDSLLSIVAAEGDESLMQSLVRLGAVVNEAVLRAALGSNSKRAVAYCVEVLGATSASVAAVLLEVASDVGMRWSVPLLRGDAPPPVKQYSVNDMDALEESIAAKNRSSVDTLIDKVGEDAIGRFGETPLTYAIAGDEDLALEWLHRFGFNLAHRDHDGGTYLMCACSWSRARVVAELIARGVDVQAEDPFGETALDRAVRAPAPACFDTIKVMLEAGARYGSKSQDRRKQGRIPDWVYRNARLQGKLPPEFEHEPL